MSVTSTTIVSPKFTSHQLARFLLAHADGPVQLCTSANDFTAHCPDLREATFHPEAGVVLASTPLEEVIYNMSNK